MYGPGLVNLSNFWGETSRALDQSPQSHIVFLIKLSPNNYLKVTNVDRNEPRIGLMENPKNNCFVLKELFF